MPNTIQLDSIDVTNASRHLIGSYIDPVFGLSKTESYVQLQGAIDGTLLYDLDSEARFDSIALVLDYDGYYYNDTLAVQEFKVFEVLEEIEPDEDFYFNTTNFATSTTALGNVIFKPRPKTEDSLFISLNHDFGEENV